MPAASQTARPRHRPRMRSTVGHAAPRAGTARPSRISSRRPAKPCAAEEWLARITVRPSASRRRLSSTSRLGRRIEMRGRLVEQQQRRVLQEGAGDRHALRLAAGQAVAALADPGVQAIRQRGGELGDAGAARGLLDLGVGGLGAGEADVVADRAGEQHRALADPGGQPRQRLRHQIGDVGTVDRHAAPVGAHEAQQDLDHRRFAGTRRAGQHQRLAGRHAERQPVQRRAARGIPGQVDVLERHGRRRAPPRCGPRAAAAAPAAAADRASASAAPVACSRSW